MLVEPVAPRKADRTLAGLLLRPPDALAAPTASTFSALAKTLGWGTGDVAAAKRQATAKRQALQVSKDVVDSRGGGLTLEMARPFP